TLHAIDFAASQINLSAAWTRVAILAVEGTCVARTSCHHRFSFSPEIETSDLPTTPELKSSVNLLLNHLWVSKNRRESIAEARSHPTPFAADPQEEADLKPATQGCGSLQPPETIADDGGTEEASPPRRQKAGGDGSVPPSPGNITRSTKVLTPPSFPQPHRDSRSKKPHRMVADQSSDRRKPEEARRRQETYHYF
ncbi:LOW QUALITY PROTEIN: hypothetical protein HID58_087977, partial [Brassica napus]